MNKKDHQNIGLTQSERDWFHAPEVRDEFRTDLKKRLIDYQKNNPSEEKSKGNKRAWKIFNWPIIQRYLPSGLAGGIISLVFALVLVSGVVYAVSKAAGYIPGFGIIHSDAPIRVLSSVEAQTIDGIQLKILSALASQESTSIVYSIKGVPPSLYAGNDPLNPEMARCPGGVQLGLPDGRVLGPAGYGSLGYGKDHDYQKVVFFEPIPENVNTVALKMDCIEGAKPQAAPENWSVPIALQASTDIKTFPILKAETRAEGEAENTLVVTELIPLEGQWIVLGRYIPDHPEVSSISLTDVAFLDVDGNHLPYRIPGDVQFFNAAEAGRFAYILDADPTSFPIELQVGSISYYCWGDTAYKLNLDAVPPDNQVHAVGATLDIGSCKIKLVSARNSGTQLTLRFESDRHKVNYVSVQDESSPTGRVTNKSFGSSATAQLTIPNLMDKKSIDLWIGGVGLEPSGPWSAKIELQDYQ